MIWNDHSKISGCHALLSPSTVSWLNYSDEESFFKKYISQYSQVLGTILHEYAEKRIKYKIRLRKNDENDVLFYLLDNGIPRNVIDMDRIYGNLLNYVNDGIGFRMDPEVILFYSNNIFGTADTISFSNNIMRISDLKTGVMPAHMEQLEIYAALACLEYHIDPLKTKFELRIYQMGEILKSEPETDLIKHTMTKIEEFDKIIESFKEK